MRPRHRSPLAVLAFAAPARQHEVATPPLLGKALLELGKSLLGRARVKAAGAHRVDAIGLLETKLRAFLHEADRLGESILLRAVHKNNPEQRFT